jgi:hypothetical protein
MMQVIEERARDPKMQEVPGGKMGLIVHKVKAVGWGKHFHRIDVYEVETRLLKELLKHERQAFQLIEGKPCACNSDIELRVSAFLPHFLGRLPSEELRRRHRQALQLPFTD